MYFRQCKRHRYGNTDIQPQGYMTESRHPKPDPVIQTTRIASSFELTLLSHSTMMSFELPFHLSYFYFYWSNGSQYLTDFASI